MVGTFIQRPSDPSPMLLQKQSLKVTSIFVVICFYTVNLDMALQGLRYYLANFHSIYKHSRLLWAVCTHIGWGVHPYADTSPQVWDIITPKNSIQRTEYPECMLLNKSQRVKKSNPCLNWKRPGMHCTQGNRPSESYITQPSAVNFVFLFFLVWFFFLAWFLDWYLVFFWALSFYTSPVVDSGHPIISSLAYIQQHYTVFGPCYADSVAGQLCGWSLSLCSGKLSFVLSRRASVESVGIASFASCQLSPPKLNCSPLLSWFGFPTWSSCSTP